jgi:hypothetical protein
MKQPPVYIDSAHPSFVCKLDKALYGLKQAPRASYSKLSMKLLKLGFFISKTDTSLFIYHKDGVIIYLLVYVGCTYHMKGMPWISCRGVECKCKAVNTPWPTTGKLSVKSGESLKDEEASHYRSIVGGLQYLMITQPDISFAVNKVCQFLHSPTTLHLEAVKRIL